LDTKTNERVLKILLEINDDLYVEMPIPAIIEKCADLDENFIKAVLYDLESHNLVENTPGDDTIMITAVTYRGLGYFREKDEITDSDIKKKKSDNKEKIKFMFYGAVITIVGRYIDTWLSFIWKLITSFFNIVISLLSTCK